MKKCKMCKVIKQKSEFSFDKFSGDKLTACCNACMKQPTSSVEVRNKMENRKRWANNVFKILDLDESEY